MIQTSQARVKAAPARKASGELLSRVLSAIRSLKRPVAFSMCVFLASFVRWFDIPSPFAAALIMCLGERSSPYTLPGLGASLALRLMWGVDADVWQYVGCMAIWLLRLRRSPREGFESAALTGLSMLPRAIAAIIASEPIMPILLCFAAIPISMLSTVALRGALISVENGYPMKTLRDRASVALLCLMLVGGLGYFRLPMLNLGHAGAVFLTVTLAYSCGASAGAACGLLCGVSLALTGHESVSLISLGLCGLLCRLAPKKRWLMPPCALAANMVAFFLTTQAQPPISFIAVAVGALAFPPMPERLAERANGFASARAGKSMESRFIRKRIEHLQGAVKQVAASLPTCEDAELSTGMELGALLCSQCSNREQCWIRGKAQTERMLSSMMELSKSGQELDISSLPMLESHGCLRAASIPDMARDALTLRARRGTARAKARFERDQTLNHLGAMLGTLGELELLAAGDSMSDLQAAHIISRAMEELQIPARLEYARRVDGHLQASLRAESVLPIQRHLEGLLRHLEECDMPMSIARAAKGCVELEEIPLYSAAVGTASLCAGAKTDEPQVCGDSVSVQRCEGGRLLLMLSDGMGHGERAHKQSEKTLELLSLLLEAGYTRRQAITAVNGIMLGTQDESFSTVDLCDIDLWSGDVYSEKLGACASWVVRGNHYKRIDGASLPLGIMEEASPTATQFRLHSGDILVMMSDGVADIFPQDDEITGLLGESLFIQPQRMADAILRNALLLGDGKPRDDMSVVVVLIMDRRRGVM